MNNNQQEQHQFQKDMQMGSGSGLTRYRSAPSSYLTDLLNSPVIDDVFGGGDDLDHLFNPRGASSPEAQRGLSNFMSCTGSVRENSSNTTLPSQPQLNPQFSLPIKAEPRAVHQPLHQLQRQHSSDYSSASQMMFQSLNSEPGNSAAMECSYSGLVGSYNVNHMKMRRVGGVGNSSLIRQSSSPAGLFANKDIENEFGSTRDMKNIGCGNSANAEASCSSASRFKTRIDFSSRTMNPIPEIDIKGMGENNADNDVDYITGLAMNGWDDSDSFMQGLTANENTRFSTAKNASANQNKEGTTRLAHHLSLPTNSSEFSAMEKTLQDSIPCKMRAKRGFATHPRSIAERVRRTKISERIRKLQELVPNMENQSNTSDMLDLAVDYIKDLQKQVKTLSDNRAKCFCSAKQNT